MSYYEVLGVSREATTEEITIAYRKLARQYHPDVNRDPEAVNKFKEIALAFETLNDTHKRNVYNTKNRIRPKKTRSGKSEKPKNPDGTVDYVQDPNMGVFQKPTPPVFDIWGRRLTPAEQEQWIRDAESDMYGLVFSQDILDAFHGKPVKRPPPAAQPRRPPPKPEFIDMYAKQYINIDMPNIRR